MPTDSQEKFRFGPFEIDLRTGELSQNGTRIRLQPQPLQVLSILLEHPGELISREEFRKRLWPDHTFVDFEHSLNTDIKKLRQCLGDEADTPRYIETLPKRGYRFKAEVSRLRGNGEPAISLGSTEVQEESSEKPAIGHTQQASGKAREWTVRVLLIFVVIALYAGWKIHKARFPQVRTKSIQRLTADGKTKKLIFSDGEHPYYLRYVDQHMSTLVQVPLHGGDDIVTPFAARGAGAPGVSLDGSHFLMCEIQSSAKSSGPLWAIPIPKGAPWRIGNVECEEAIYLSNGEIAATLKGELRVFDTAGAQLRSLGKIPTPTAGGMRLSPDGKRIRMGREGIDEIDAEETWEIGVDGTNLHQLFRGARTKLGAWTADGRVYVFPMFEAETQSWNLWGATEVSPSIWNLYRTPKPSRLTFAPPQATEPAVGKNGEMFFLGYDRRGETSVYDPQKKSRKPFLDGIAALAVSYSNDQKWMTYISYPDQSLWRSRPDGSEKIRLTQPPLRVLMARWAPDDKLIAFHEISNRSKIYLVGAEGGAPSLILGGGECAGDPGWSPDGRKLVYGGCEDSKTLKLRIHDLETQETTEIEGSDELFSPRWSRDGRWIAALHRDSAQLLLYDLEKRQWQKLPPLAPGECCSFPAFSHDSRYLYEEDGNVWRYEIASGRWEMTMQLENHDTAAVWWGLGFSLTPNGEIIRMREMGTQEIYRVIVETY